MWHLYGLVLGIAAVVGLSVAERIDVRVNKVFPWVLSGGLIGARLYHVIDYKEYYQQFPGEIWAVWSGGLGIWGGVIGGAMAILIYQKLMKLKQFGKLVMAIVIALPLAQAIGRVGNYANGEFVTKVGLMPWWSMEAILNLALFGLLWRLNRRGHSSQAIVGTYLAGYGLIRFGLEFWRSDSWKWSGLGVAQWISLLSIVIGLSLWRQRNVQE